MSKLKILLIIILTLAFIGLAIAIYFLFTDIKSKMPNILESKYDINIQEYKNRNIFTVSPKENKQDKYILYFHGGAYMAEITDYHWNFIEKLIENTSYSVIIPDYPLTPKNNYKNVFEMIEPLYKKIIEKVEPKNLIMMGDSAGGGMALALEEKLGEEQIELPNKLILISPWIDVTMKNTEIDKIQKYDTDLNKEALKVAGTAYAGKDGMESYLVNPINGPVENLKNVTIFTGTYDILNPDSKIFVEKAKEKGVNINLKEYDKKGHIWVVKNSECEEFDDVINEIIS